MSICKLGNMWFWPTRILRCCSLICILFSFKTIYLFLSIIMLITPLRSHLTRLLTNILLRNVWFLRKLFSGSCIRSHQHQSFKLSAVCKEGDSTGIHILALVVGDGHCEFIVALTLPSSLSNVKSGVLWSCFVQSNRSGCRYVTFCALVGNDQYICFAQSACATY